MGTKPRGRPIVWISVTVASVIVFAIIIVLSLSISDGQSTSKVSSASGRSTTTTTTTASCAGSSTAQTVSLASGPVVLGATGKAALGVTCPDGHLGTILYYDYTQPIKMTVTVPDSLTPTAIQTVLDGNPKPVNQWDVNSTERIYVLDYGGAGESPEVLDGTHTVYAIVTFSDNSSVTSNLVTFTVKIPRA